MTAVTERGQHTRPRASVIIPAHDEATIIGRLLDQIRELGADHDVLVVANGCTDSTASVVSAHPWCRLIEIEAASKPAALNAGDAAALAYPRIYLDADVTVSTDSLRQLIDVLDGPAPLVASPPVRIDHTGASLLARAYQRVWALTDYRLHDHTGSGIYGLSEAGRARFGAFPHLIADDLYVRQLFGPTERRVSPGAPFTIHAPRTVRAQARRLGRTMAGELQLAQQYPQLQPEGGADASRRRLLGRIGRRPALWPAFAVYATTYVTGRVLARVKLARGRTDVWERDETTR
jgi:hypothetical protein